MSHSHAFMVFLNSLSETLQAFIREFVIKTETVMKVWSMHRLKDRCIFSQSSMWASISWNFIISLNIPGVSTRANPNHRRFLDLVWQLMSKWHEQHKISIASGFFQSILYPSLTVLINHPPPQRKLRWRNCEMFSSWNIFYIPMILSFSGFGWDEHEIVQNIDLLLKRSYFAVFHNLCVSKPPFFEILNSTDWLSDDSRPKYLPTQVSFFRFSRIEWGERV